MGTNSFSASEVLTPRAMRDFVIEFPQLGPYTVGNPFLGALRKAVLDAARHHRDHASGMENDELDVRELRERSVRQKTLGTARLIEVQFPGEIPGGNV